MPRSDPQGKLGRENHIKEAAVTLTGGCRCEGIRYRLEGQPQHCLRLSGFRRSTDAIAPAPA